MNIYLVERTDEVGYDEYDAFVVVAESPKKAKEFTLADNSTDRYGTWSNKLKTTKVGTTHLKKPQYILGSFNAG